MIAIGVAALALQLAVASTGSGTVQGAVRSEVGGDAIVGARITLLDVSLVVASDTAGRYELRDIATGTHKLRFEARGYQLLEVDVLLVGDVPLRLDVSLSRIPAQLIPVRVLATTGGGSPDSKRSLHEVGSWRTTAFGIAHSPMLDEPDAFRILATLPQVQMSAEAPASVNVRGGSADQNLFLLDGAPVYSPLHSGPVLSAISPDIVDELVLHGAAPSARYGGRLSGVIDVRTRPAVPSTFSTRGGFSSSGVRTAFEFPLIPARVGLTLSARHSYSGLQREDAAERAMPGVWSDEYAKLGTRLGGNDISIASFSADNGLGFPDGGRLTGRPITGPRSNHFNWESSTRSVGWQRAVGSGGTFEARLWRAAFSAVTGWSADSGGLQLNSSFRDAGLSALVSVPWRQGRWAAGAETQRIEARYVMRSDDTLRQPAPAGLLSMSSAPLLQSLFVEGDWSPSSVWTFNGGLRGTLVTNDVARFEPRLSITAQPRTWLGVSAGYARMHQYSQSLRNEESLLGTVMGLDLPVAMGAPHVPVASSDELSAAATLSPAAHTSITLDWYGRRLQKLLLVAPVTSGPFATRDFIVGSGRAWGTGIRFEHQLDRLTLEGSYAVRAVSRHGDTVRYRPGFAPSQTASFAAAYRLGTLTHLRSAMWLTSGRRSTTLGDAISWDTRDGFSGAREISGSPQHTVGALGGQTLPPYFRVDIGARRTIPLGARGALVGFATLENLTGRRNAAGYMTPPSGERLEGLWMLPRSAIFGLEWRY